MRHAAIALVALLAASLGVVAPAPSAPEAVAATPPKVAIIVGATHGSTDRYRQHAEQLYAQAIQYTPNVVRVYSPDATWSAVRSAVNGASIVVYLGHGNGWPSPYSYDPAYTTKNGFGLNASAGNGDYNNKYYGEPYIETLTPARNAVVLLFHLCYAAGNSEPGQPEPSLAVARQRADNYASAFLRAGAAAVIADGHSHDPYYISSLFTSYQTLDAMWRGAPNFNFNVQAYASTRTPGSTSQLDPETPTTGFYRAITGRLDARTDQVTGGGFGPTDVHPGAFVVPGAAEVVAPEGAPLLADPTGGLGFDAWSTLPAGTPVRIDAQATGYDGALAYRVATLDGSQAGWARATALAPRDSMGPRVLGISGDAGGISPNGDGLADSLALEVQLSESASWSASVSDPNGWPVAQASGTGPLAAIAWDGRIGGAPAPDGTYRWTLEASDAWGNLPLRAAGSVRVDGSAPVPVVAAPEGIPISISPNADGVRDTLALKVELGEPGTVDATVTGSGGTVARMSTPTAGTSATLAWSGAAEWGGQVPDGQYQLEIRARDAAGNVSAPVTRQLVVYAPLSPIVLDAAQFFPHDGDGLAATSQASFSVRTAATVSAHVVDARGTVVRALVAAVPMAPGPQVVTWDGRNDAGALVARGTYRFRITATDGILEEVVAKPVVADAFRVVSSDSTPARGQRIVLTATSTESLAAAPRLTVRQPGATAWSVTMTRLSGRVYRATITLRSGTRGTVRFVVAGTDTAGGRQTSTLALPIH